VRKWEPSAIAKLNVQRMADAAKRALAEQQTEPLADDVDWSRAQRPAWEARERKP
jgi:hypothetical protein